MLPCRQQRYPEAFKPPGFYYRVDYFFSLSLSLPSPSNDITVWEGWVVPRSEGAVAVSSYDSVKTGSINTHSHTHTNSDRNSRFEVN